MAPDDLDDLRAGMARATPRPDPGVRAAHLALAQENFERLQASAASARLTPAPRKGLLGGAREMLSALTTRGGLTATTALVAVGVLVLTPMGRDVWERGPVAPGGETATEVEAPPRPEVAAVDPEAALTEIPEPAVETAEATVEAPAPDPADAVLPGAAVEAPSAEPEALTGFDVAESEVVLDEAPPADRDAAATEGTRAELAPPAAPAEPRGRAAGAATADAIAPPASVAPAPAPADEFTLGLSINGQDGPALGQMEVGEGTLDFATMQSSDFSAAPPAPSTEAFANADENPVRITAEAPVSTFSIDVDTASYAVVRQSLMAGALPPPDAVRVEEMVNYFPYDLPAPAEGEGPFRPTVSVAPTPWNPGTRLVTIQIQGETPSLEDRPPLDLVFLIDTSGSMDPPERLPLLRQSFRLMVDELRPEDRVAIVTYAGSAGLVLPPTPATDRRAILAALDALAAGGSTNGQGGLEQAYAVAEGMAREGVVSRVILATDGDFNVGLDDPSALEDYIAERRESGVYLSVLGFGRGNLDDATMQALAQNGNGTAAYIDTLGEAQKVLVDQLAGALYPIASDVKVQVEWNPAEVAEYRLIGYETRALRREDFNDDRVDAGDLGAGHAVTALYEVTPVGSPAQLSDPLRYAAEAAPASSVPGELGFLRLRWTAPGEGASELLETPIRAEAGTTPEAGFAAAVAGWGQLLRGSPYPGDWGYDEAIALAAASRGEDPFGYRNEALRLMRLSQGLSDD